MKRILTGVDPRKANAQGGTAPAELTAEQIEGKRNVHLFKMGTLAKELGTAWNSAGTPTTLFPDDVRREKITTVLQDTASIKLVPSAAAVTDQ